MFYKVEEAAGQYYFLWEGLHGSPESAMRSIERELGKAKALIALMKGRVRIVQYMRGNGNKGPERAE